MFIRKTRLDTVRRAELERVHGKPAQEEETVEVEDEYPFVCDDYECEKKYKSEWALNRHKGQKHEED